MIDTVPINVLKNCTVEVINQYPELTTVNESDIWIYNRSNVLETLTDLYDKFNTQHLYLDTELRVSFKWVNKFYKFLNLFEY